MLARSPPSAVYLREGVMGGSSPISGTYVVDDVWVRRLGHDGCVRMPL